MDRDSGSDNVINDPAARVPSKLRIDVGSLGVSSEGTQTSPPSPLERTVTVPETSNHGSFSFDISNVLNSLHERFQFNPNLTFRQSMASTIFSDIVGPETILKRDIPYANAYMPNKPMHVTNVFDFKDHAKISRVGNSPFYIPERYKLQAEKDGHYANDLAQQGERKPTKIKLPPSRPMNPIRNESISSPGTLFSVETKDVPPIPDYKLQLKLKPKRACGFFLFLIVFAIFAFLCLPGYFFFPRNIRVIIKYVAINPDSLFVAGASLLVLPSTIVFSIYNPNPYSMNYNENQLVGFTSVSGLNIAPGTLVTKTNYTISMNDTSTRNTFADVCKRGGTLTITSKFKMQGNLGLMMRWFYSEPIIDAYVPCQLTVKQLGVLQSISKKK